MNALTQYLELWHKYHDLIDANAPEAFNRRRRHALEVLEKAGRLPERGDEGYNAVSVNDMFAPDYGLNLQRLSCGDVPGGCDIHNAGTIAVTIINDECRPLDVNLPAGLTIEPLRVALCRHDMPAVGSIAPEGNPAVALNDLLVQDGLYIRVEAGVRVERPVQLLSLFNASRPTMALRRLYIEMGEGSSLAVMACDHPRASGVCCMNSRVVEVSLAARASLDFYDIEEAGNMNRRMSVFAARQDTASRLNVSSVTLSGGITRNEYSVRYAGDGCYTSLGGLVIASGEQIADNATHIIHDTQRCCSEQLFKYALFDSAQGGFEGLVNVCPGALYTDARQSNRNMLICENARMHAMPQLIINCDEVKASHGSATGQLDAEALFYMRSRGIPQDEARMMLVNAFMAEGLDKISHAPLQQALRHLVDRRLRGCSGCTDCKVQVLQPRWPVIG